MDFDMSMFGDPSQLQGLLNMLGPTEDEKKKARMEAIMAAGLGLLGTTRGNEMQGIGRAGLLGMGAYNQGLRDITQQRGQSLSQASSLMEMARRAQLSKEMMGASASPPAYGMGDRGAGPATPPNLTVSTLRQRALQMGISGDEISLAAQAKDPAEALAKLMMEYRKPHFGAGSNPIERDGAGGWKTTLPTGAPEAAESMALAAARAQERAKAETDTIQVDMGNGQKVLMPRAEYLRQYGQLQQQPQIQKAPVFHGDLSTADINRAMQDFTGEKPFEKIDPTYTPTSAGALGVTPNPITMKQREGEVASQTAQNTKVGEGFAKKYLDVVESGTSAAQNVARLSQLKDYLGRVETGKMAPLTMTLKAYASYAAPDLTKEWTKDVPYAQAATALANEMALQLRNPAEGGGMPGSLSNADREYLKQMVANVGNDPRAIPLMLDARIAIEKRNQEISAMARKYRGTTGKVDEGFFDQMQQYSDANPLFQAPAQAQQTPAAAPSVQDLANELRKRGLIK